MKTFSVGFYGYHRVHFSYPSTPYPFSACTSSDGAKAFYLCLWFIYVLRHCCCFSDNAHYFNEHKYLCSSQDVCDAVQQALIIAVCVSIFSVLVKYHGRAAHASAYPWEGVNALDAAVMAYSNVSVLRQQFRPDWRIHGELVSLTSLT